MPISTNFEELWGIFTPCNCEIIVLTPSPLKDTHFQRRHAFCNIFCVKIGSAVSSVGLFKNKHHGNLKKKVIGRTPKCYVSPIWGASPSNSTVTKFCMWVPIPDVIICARFYLYRPVVFLEGGGRIPENWLFPYDLCNS